jgi:hypothetical protein
MDEIAYVLGEGTAPDVDELRAELEVISGECHWTEGTWRFGPRDRCAWNELQNTPRDILRLSDHLVGLYRNAKKSPERRAAA